MAALRSMPALGIGAGLVIPLYGYLTRQLYLGGYGIDYAKFATSADLTIDALQGVALVLPITLAAVVLALLIPWVLWATLSALRWLAAQRKPVVMAAASAARYVVRSSVLPLVRRISAAGRASDVHAPSLVRWEYWASQSRPVTFVRRGAYAPPTEHAIVFTAIVLTALITAIDLAGRYAASRIELAPPRASDAQCVDGLQGCVLALVAETWEKWGITSAPRSVRLVGTNERLPQAFRTGLVTPCIESASCRSDPIEFQLIGKNASFYFLRACSPRCVDAASSGVIAVSTQAAVGVSFLDALHDDAVPKSAQPDRTLAEMLESSTRLAGSLSEAAKRFESAAASFPRTLTARGEVTLAAKAPIAWNLSADAWQSLIGLNAYELQARYRMDHLSRAFEDCVDKRRLTRNLVQMVAGRYERESDDCERFGHSEPSTRLPEWLVPPVLAGDPEREPELAGSDAR